MTKELTSTELRLVNTIRNLEKRKNILVKHEKRLVKLTNSLRTLSGEDLTMAEFDITCCKYDISVSKRKIIELNIKIVDLQKKQKEENNKNDIPYIKPLEDFLQNYIKRNTEYYSKQRPICQATIQKCKEEQKALSRKDFKNWNLYTVACNDISKSHLRGYTKDVINYSSMGDNEFINRLAEDLTDEAQALKIDLYWRTVAICGVLTDTSRLSIAENGSLNGFVSGEEGSAEVDTIIAGGYNIQRLHYRVIIKKI